MLYVFAMGNMYSPHCVHWKSQWPYETSHTEEFPCNVKNSPTCARKGIWPFLFLSHPLVICLPHNESIVDWKPRWAFSIYQNFSVGCVSSATTGNHHFFFSCLQSIVSRMGRKHGNSDDLYGKKENPLFTQQIRFCLAFSCTQWGTSLVGSELESPQVGSVPRTVSPRQGLLVVPRVQHQAPSLKILGMGSRSSCPEPHNPRMCFSGR